MKNLDPITTVLSMKSYYHILFGKMKSVSRNFIASNFQNSNIKVIVIKADIHSHSSPNLFKLYKLKSNLLYKQMCNNKISHFFDKEK